MTNTKVISMDCTGDNPCCCPCVLNLELLVLGSAGSCGAATAVTAGTDCEGVTPNRTVNGIYQKGATVNLFADATVTCSGPCGSVVADFAHWEISCDGGEPYEDSTRNTTLEMGDGESCNCTATAVYVPRDLPITVQCVAVTLCNIENCCSGVTNWRIASGDDISVTPRGVPLECGFGFLKPCQGGPSSVTICVDPAPLGCQCPSCATPWIELELCKLVGSVTGHGSCPAAQCNDGPCMTLSLTCLNSATTGNAGALPTYALTADGACGSCGDCDGTDYECP